MTTKVGKSTSASLFWQYLNQPVFDPTYETIFNPFKFWRLNCIQIIQACWDNDFVDLLEQCWQQRWESINESPNTDEERPTGGQEHHHPSGGTTP